MIPEITPKVERQAWQKALLESFQDVPSLLAFLKLKPEQIPYLDHTPFPFRVPHAFAEKMKKGDPYDPILLQVLPHKKESKQTIGFVSDPLAESKASPVPGLLHKFKNRVLLVLSGSCALHCRYCFRRAFPYAEHRLNRGEWTRCFEYIAQTPAIEEVILSGGDPLNLTDAHLGWFIQQLEQIPHLKIIRIHTRTPVAIPSRLTANLIQTLRSRLPIVMVLHINHPQELCDALHAGVLKLKKVGLSVYHQSVLLKGINDDVDTLVQLSYQLFSHGIQPYYLHLLDKVSGSAHFEVEASRIPDLIRALYARLPGYLVPRVVREIPGLPFKSPLFPTES